MIQEYSAITDSVKLHSVQTNKFKTGILSFTVTMPMSRLDSPYSLILSKILEKNTKSYPSRLALSRRIDDLYVSSTDIRRIGFGKNMILSASAEMLDERYCKNGAAVTKDICELLKEFILSPVFDEDGFFPEEAFEHAKHYSSNALKAIINNPGAYASLRLYELLKRNEPDNLSFEETIAEVENCDRFTLTEFYKENIASRPIDVYYVGSLSHEYLADKLLCVLGKHRATKKDSVVPLCANNEPREIIRKNETMPISQARLAIGFRTNINMGDKDYPAALLFDELFGGSPASKLFMNVRERQSLCYSCGSNYSSTTGTLFATAGISPKNRKITEETILAELENIKAGKITNKEFSSSKNSLLNSIRETYDNPTEILEYYLYSNTAGIKLTLDEYTNAVSLVNKDDVVRVAKSAVLDCIYFLSSQDGSEVKGE